MNRHPAPAARRHRRSYLLSGLLAALTLAALLIPSAASAAPRKAHARTAAVTTTAPNCGPKIYKADGTPWTCTFDDEFTGSGLDTSKWTAWNQVNWATNGNECYFSSPQYVNVSGGHLSLTMSKLSQPFACGGIGTTATWGSGFVHTKNKFSQAYGRWDIRAKMATGWGVDSALWLWPQNKTYPGHAEIDIAELFGWSPDKAYSSLHWTNTRGSFATASKACTVASASTSYHTYTMEWAPTGIKFLEDNALCYQVSNWNPLTGYAFPAPFNQPFYLNLQLGQMAGAGNYMTIRSTSMQVDYVRVWK